MVRAPTKSKFDWRSTRADYDAVFWCWCRFCPARNGPLLSIKSEKLLPLPLALFLEDGRNCDECWMSGNWCTWCWAFYCSVRAILRKPLESPGDNWSARL